MPRASELNLPNSSTYFTRNPSLDSEYLRRADSTMSVRSRSNTGGGGSGITSRDFWMSDEKVKECYDCKALFTAFRRRHHCRIWYVNVQQQLLNKRIVDRSFAINALPTLFQEQNGDT